MTKAKTSVSASAKALAQVAAKAPAQTVGQLVAETPAHSAPALTVGFEKALVMLNPEWRTAMSEDEVNRARHFYHQGIQDVYLVARIGEQQLAQNFQAIMGTLVAGSEAKIAEQQAALDAAAKTEAPVDVERAAVGLPPKASKPKATKGKKKPTPARGEHRDDRW